MNIILEIFLVMCSVTWAIITSIYRCFVSPRSKSVKNNIVLITGAGSGLGRLLSKKFAIRGAIIVAWDVNKAGNEETKREVESNGGVIYTYYCDVG